MGSDAKERLLSMNPWVDLDWPERCKQAAARIAELEAALSAATAERDELRNMSDAHREHAQSAVENSASLNRLLSIAEAAREAAEAEAARLREAFREQRLKPGVRAVITAVHKRATEMGDQKCKDWLNSLGFELGLQLSRDRMDLAEAVEGSFTRAALGAGQ